MAAVAPFLILTLLVAADFGRMFYLTVELRGAARAAAQYGSQSLVTASDSSGMTNAAQANASNVSQLKVTATQCTCLASQSVAACPSSYCTSLPQAAFVRINTSAPFSTLVAYPGIPASTTLTGQAIMPVQQ
jgi:Flp pilus assembly protein TadG